MAKINKKENLAAGVSKSSKKAPMVDPKGAWTKVQERTLGNMKKGGKVKKAMGGMSLPSVIANKIQEKQAEKYKSGGAVKAKGGKWIQKAIKKPGALRAQLGAKPGKPIAAGKLAKAAKAPGKLGQRARLAKTLGKMRKK